MLQTKSIVLTIFIAVICEVEMVNAVDLNREISESLKEARELIENEQYETAFDILIVEITKNPNDADAHNLAGFAARNSGNLGDAATHYAIALQLDPEHKGALEYQGELYLLLKRPKKAKINLERLHQICGIDCEEYQDLLEALSNYQD